ncbi:MAG: low molecular weight protein-tyrosine-phosphatase [Candidatus Competibacteraceae bacterium]|nr:low molecular weight protein-tyrosine-phosphatase [Candidatus Competibacteraceae bacterium]
MKEKAAVRVLFVCMGNICRSPTAEGVCRRMLEDLRLVDRVYIESAGTHAYHIGHPPDKRSQQAARRRGADLSRLRARQVVEEDLEEFDYVLAMDQDNYQRLLAMAATAAQRDRVRLLMDYAPRLPEREVPDPYYGNLGGFDRVLDLVEEACQGLILELRQRYQL